MRGGFAVLLLAALVAPAQAQDAGRVFRVGVIAPSEGAVVLIRQLTLPELARRGFVEGRNLVVEERFGVPGMMTDLARQLVGTRPDVVVAVSETAIRPVL